MDLKKILLQYKQNKLTLNQVLNSINNLPYEKLSHSILDIHREIRKGIPEIIYSEHKTPQQIIDLINRSMEYHKFVIATRLDSEKYKKIKESIPKQHKYFEVSRILVVGIFPKRKKGNVLIITAGTTDIPVAEESATICEILGNKTKRVYDIGVAGLHRLTEILPYISKARVVIVVAGMDAVLPSVIGGISKVPVIAVPTSTGYGANFKGLSSLLTMLNSCSPGIAVVNIDNGFGAGYIASLINK